MNSKILVKNGDEVCPVFMKISVSPLVDDALWLQFIKSSLTRAVKLKISWEEWDFCFYFSFLDVLDFLKDV